MSTAKVAAGPRGRIRAAGRFILWRSSVSAPGKEEVLRMANLRAKAGNGSATASVNGPAVVTGLLLLLRGRGSGEDGKRG